MKKTNGMSLFPRILLRFKSGVNNMVVIACTVFVPFLHLILVICSSYSSVSTFSDQVLLPDLIRLSLVKGHSSSV